VVLAGKKGCLVATSTSVGKNKSKKITLEWLPLPYDRIFFVLQHRCPDQGGAMFAGALTYAMGKGDSAVVAAKKAAAAVSFLLELDYWARKPSRRDGQGYHPFGIWSYEKPPIAYEQWFWLN
jgi:hypothetical protein